jgi:ribonuclease HI
MTTTELPELIRPSEPEKTDEEYHELNMALASVLTTLKKHKNILVKKAQLETWSQHKIEITLLYKPSSEKWKAHSTAEREYYLEKKRREELEQCNKFGITVEQLREAKKRHELYQAKKCDKAPAHELDYFVERVLTTVPGELAES